MGTIQGNAAAIKLAVPPAVYERMRQTIDDLLVTIRSAYANGLGNEDELRRAERVSIGLSADFGCIEVLPEPPEVLCHALRYRFQDYENGRPQGPALLVDYRVVLFDEIEILRIAAEEPFADLSGFTDDSCGVLDESLIDTIIREIQQYESNIHIRAVDRRYDEMIDRQLEGRIHPVLGKIIDTVRPKEERQHGE